MKPTLSFRSLLRTLTIITALGGMTLQAADPIKIVLVAGTVKEVDRPGHHDYLGGCRLMQALLGQTEGVEAALVTEGWPSDESVFEGAKAIVFYTDGAGKQAYLESPERVAVIEELAAKGTGIVSIHQAVEFPAAFSKQSAEWTGGNYTPLSSRGHWDSKHEIFPDHPVTRGVIPWEINDGWLNRFKFPAGMKGITPLVWSGKEHLGSPEGGPADIVAWTFDRPGGGRSFNFSGLDAHSAWERVGMRTLVINGILWSAGAEIPQGGAKSEADQAMIDSFLTPRIAPEPKKKAPAAPATTIQK